MLARRAPPNARVGLLIDHDQLAENVNAEVLASHGSAYDPPHSVSVPAATGLHWRGIQARIDGFGEVRAARISGDRNPAHPLANAPDQYAHVNGEPDRCVLPDAPTVTNAFHRRHAQSVARRRTDGTVQQSATGDIVLDHIAVSSGT